MSATKPDTESVLMVCEPLNRWCRRMILHRQRLLADAWRDGMRDWGVDWYVAQRAAVLAFWPLAAQRVRKPH